MIRIRCPKCKREIDLEDFRAGHVGRCLQCRQKFRVPGARRDARGAPTLEHEALANAPPLAEEVEAEETRAYAFNPGSSGQMELVEDSDAHGSLPEEPSPSPRRSPRREYPEPDSIEHEEQDEQPAKKRKKKKKKKRSASSAPQVLMPVLVVASTVVVLVGLAWFFRPVVYALWIVGILCTLVGRRMFLKIAAEDGVGTWLACLFIPFYSTYYFFKNINLMLGPFLVSCCGYGLLGGALVLWVVHGVRELGQGGAAGAEEPSFIPSSLVLEVDDDNVTLPVQELTYFHVKRGREEFPDYFEFSGKGVSIWGNFPLGFDEDWPSLIGKPVTILPRHQQERGVSEISLRGRGSVKITGGSFTIQKIVKPGPDPTLRGTIVLECEGDLTIEGTFQVNVSGVY